MALSRRASCSLPALKTSLSRISFPASHRTSLRRASRIKRWSMIGVLHRRLWYIKGAAEIPTSRNPVLEPAFICIIAAITSEPLHRGGGELFQYLVQSKGVATEGSIDSSILDTSPVSPSAETDNVDAREKPWECRPPSGGRGGTCTVDNTFHWGCDEESGDAGYEYRGESEYDGNGRGEWEGEGEV